MTAAVLTAVLHLGIPAMTAAQSVERTRPEPQAGPQEPAGPPSQGGGAAEHVATSGIAVVSRERILREAEPARRLRETEEGLAQRLQSQIGETKAALAAEEEELARVRGTMPEAEFEARVADFDERVRLARRNAQERAAALQEQFQDARAALVAALPPLLERLRIEAGAVVILNAEQTLALDPALDLTDRAIALLDAQSSAPAVPEVDLSMPLWAPQDGAGASAAPLEATGATVDLPGDLDDAAAAESVVHPSASGDPPPGEARPAR